MATEVAGRAYIAIKFVGFDSTLKTKFVMCSSFSVGGGGLQEWSSPSLLVGISPDDSPLGLG